MRLKQLALGTLFCVAGMACNASHADTLTLSSVGGQQAAGVYVYPYNFSINGSSTLTSLMCIDLNREVTVGETWNVTEQGIDDSSADAALREDAWLYTQFGQIDPQTNAAYTNAEVQFAVWDVLDASGISSNSSYAAAFDGASSYLVGQAQAAANDMTLYNSGFFSQFTVFAPTSDTTGWTDSTPQRFLGDAASVTPEPSSLILLGSGLLAMAVMVLRRRNGLSFDGV